MAAEDQASREATNLGETKREHSLDELAQGFASGTISWRRALRSVVGAFVGSMLASIPRVARAQDRERGNRACAHFCAKIFPPGPQRGKCVSDAAHGRGPCFSCTPGVGPGPNFVPPPCPGNQTFNTTTCQCEAGCTLQACTFEAGFKCGDQLCTCPGSPYCFYFRTAEGTGVCIDEERAGVCQAGCNSTQECQQLFGPRAVCLVDTCCDFPGYRGECHIRSFYGLPERC